MASWRAGRWTPDQIEVLRAILSRNREALGLLDRASSLPFVGFLGGTSYNYRVGDLMRLARLCEFRAAVASFDGDGDAALASFYADARLVRAIDLTPLAIGSVAVPLFSGFGAAIERTAPSAAAREPLARALADIDRDDRHAQALLRYRSSILSDGVSSQFYRGPLMTHFLVTALDVSSTLLTAARQPWPARIEAMNAVGAWPLVGFASRSEGGKAVLRNYTRSIADQIRRIRCARLIVSPSPVNLIDPLTGQRLEGSACRH